MEPLFEKFGIKKNAGELIFCEYEPGYTMFFLLKGKVKLSKITKEKEKLIAYLEEGAIFGEMSLLDNKLRSATCLAETNCELLELDRENFETLVHAKPSLGINLLYTFVNRIRDQERKFRILNHESDELKVLDTLVMLLEERGVDPDSRNVTISEKIETVANWSGIEENYCREILDKIQKTDKIAINENGIIVKNLENIKTLLEKE